MLIIDQVGREVVLTKTPERIVSLVPSQSEFIWDLGLKDQLVGITKFCIHPKEMYTSVQKVGGTKNPSLEKIAQLKPDLIIANKEENTEESVFALEKICPVYVSDVNCLDDAYKMMFDIGNITSKTAPAKVMIHHIKAFFDTIKRTNKYRVVYVIWQKPVMCVGAETFIDSILSEIGLVNCYSGFSRYPETNFETIQEMKPDFIFLSSEPFPFGNDHLKEWREHFPTSKVLIVDGEFFSWYGSRLCKSENYFLELLNKLEY